MHRGLSLLTLFLKGGTMEIFISDLDGTLLNKRGSFSENTINILRPLIKNGLHFTVATARTPFSAIPISKILAIKDYMVLLNGAVLYDPVKMCFFHPVELGREAMKALQEAEQEGIQGMLFAMRGNELCVYPGKVKKHLWDGYFDFSQTAGILSVCREVPEISARDLQNEPVIYGLYMDDKQETLAAMKEKLSKRSGLALDFYKDQYTKERWCLEICSGNASKGRAVESLRTMMGGGRFTAFGDSRNDISLFQACEKAFAVENACEELKQMADGILLDNERDGVARYIQRICQRNAREL